MRGPVTSCSWHLKLECHQCKSHIPVCFLPQWTTLYNQAKKKASIVSDCWKAHCSAWRDASDCHKRKFTSNACLSVHSALDFQPLGGYQYPNIFFLFFFDESSFELLVLIQFYFFYSSLLIAWKNIVIFIAGKWSLF